MVWFFLIRAIWRAELFERFLGLDKTNDPNEFLAS
jgi:hypothetical protein